MWLSGCKKEPIVLGSDNPNPNSPKGIYEFELTVTDKAGLTGKDTATVIVGEMSANPKDIIFKDLVWSCPWYYGVEIKNIYSHLPSGSVFKVYIQRDNSATWLEVVPELQWLANVSYYFSLYNGDLWISYYGSDVADKPDIKLVY